ncbi:hypothetical protein QFC19_008178 [Naganishia cerealis]|uniref:Uncharacterized protein n=1 Tax=Naganishia cerealis TaxID=610337 RepID=A0ACC2V434_9TREE|nr:hypothetical protein QFC19_008178 [Naganishia cerealis]
MLRPRPGALIQLIAPRPDAAAIQRRATPTFPLEFTEKRRGVGYYIALAVVFSVFGITPLCFLWVIAYALRARKWDGWMGVWAFGGFAYSVAEYITQIVQQPAPPSKLTPEQCRLFFVKMLQIGMQDAEGSGTQGGSEKDEDIPSARDIQERLEDVISLARTGQLDTKRDHIHPHPQQQAAMNAPSAVTPATTTSSGLRNRFGHPNKLTQATRMSDPVADGVQSPIIRLRRLEKDDPRAIAFREKMRNWYAP